MVEWSKDHMTVIGSLNSTLCFMDRTWLNWRSGGALRWKVRPSVNKFEEWYVASQHLQGCSPRLHRLRTDGLVPVSKY
jgi:hypothetical protein